MENSLFDLDSLKEFAQRIFVRMQPQCVSIYLGGSICDGIITNPHDVDIICFSEKPIGMCALRREVCRLKRDKLIPDNYDLIQIRNKTNEERALGSYINKRMIRIAGEDLRFSFDVIDADREEYIGILLNAIDRLNSVKVHHNQKRWYQILRGYWIVKNRTYDTTSAQRNILNIVHDQESGWEKYKITKEDILALRG